jgi:hypothetical protein
MRLFDIAVSVAAGALGGSLVVAAIVLSLCRAVESVPTSCSCHFQERVFVAACLVTCTADLLYTPNPVQPLLR